jgi:hypothetical protein
MRRCVSAPVTLFSSCAAAGEELAAQAGEMNGMVDSLSQVVTGRSYVYSTESSRYAALSGEADGTPLLETDYEED